MNLKFSVILGFIFAALTDAADSTTTTCTDNLQCSSCLCVSANNSMTFAKGDTTTICAHFVTVNNTSGCIVAERAAYPVVVDTFSSIQLTGGQTYFQNYGFVEIVIQVYGTVMSIPLTYLQLTEFYSSAFSIIIELDNGVVQSAYWDHECATCSSSDCYQFTMSNGTVIDSICNSPNCISTNDSSCDPQIYVAWIGTDSKGNQLTSAGMRLSRFDQFSLSDIISANTINPYVIPTPTNTTNTTTNDTSGGNTTGAGNTTDTSGNKTDTNTTTTNTTDTSGNKTDTNTTTTNTTDSSGNKTDTNTTTTNTTDTSGNKTDTNTTTTNTTDTSGNKTDTNTTDTSGNKTDTNTTTTNTTDSSGNKTDTNTTTTNTTDTSGNKTDTNTTTTNTTDTSGTKTDTNTTDTSGSTTDPKTSTETSPSTSSGGSSATDTGSSTSTGTDTSTKGDTTTTTGTDTSTKDGTTTVTKL